MTEHVQSSQAESTNPKILSPLLLHDITLIVIMGVLAGCGLIYEYLLSHYAGRVLGAMEVVIYGMIGLMIVAMGFGAFSARKIRCPFTGFAWLEIIIAALGASAVLIIASAIALGYFLPALLSDTFNLPPDIRPKGNFIGDLQVLAEATPFIAGFVLAFLIGMEIPLIARVRERVYGMHLEHNTGTIYGADYIGAGIGAALWVFLMLRLEITLAAVLTAAANLVAGLIFFFVYRKHIRYGHLLLACHILLAIVLLFFARFGNNWETELEDLLYADKVIYSINTRYQHVTVTKRLLAANQPVYSLFLNGRTQFDSSDENIYHSMLVYPPMAASAHHDNILVVGGGDGLAVRNILRWNPKQITLLELDSGVINFFRSPLIKNGKTVNQALLQLNEFSLQDDRVNFIIDDAFNSVNTLLQQQRRYDTIIVDLPDPSHPDLNKLYSARFYTKLRHLLTGDGVICVQSTSPYHARKAFISIGKTMEYAGFKHVEQYHQNVPSFGEWGWTIATVEGLSPKQRLQQLNQLPVADSWVTKPLILAAFEFPANFYAQKNAVEVNRLSNLRVYHYHQQAWLKDQGLPLNSNLLKNKDLNH